MRYTTKSHSVSSLFTAFANKKRRQVLIALYISDERIDIEESDFDHESLRHMHLPSLEEQEFIEWDDGVVETGPQWESAESMLDYLKDTSSELTSNLDKEFEDVRRKIATAN